MNWRTQTVVGAGLLVVLAGVGTEARELSFDERVDARVALETVYHRYRTGTALSSEQALSRERLETIVHRQIARSTFVDTQRPGLISHGDLHRERERIERNSVFPGRLRELYAALGNDSTLIDESLIRPLLVERAARRLEVGVDDAFGEVSRAPFVPPGQCAVGDVWSPTNGAGSPTGRKSSRAVWTGNLMLVWGGGDPVHLDTGGRYDPVLDNWSPITTTGAPAARFGHTLVWSGDAMVVWGGRTAVDHVADGARYDPALDEWSTVSSVGAPEQRSNHTAVWSGSEMIVWGGWNEVGGAFNSPGCLFGVCCGDYLLSGGRYDPASDSWTATSTAAAPHGVQMHAAVWTGQQMIVWGGEFFDEHPVDCSAAQNWAATGGRYDPATDSWAATSLSGNPRSRRGPSAVWTGDEMIIWGGSEDESGRYDPVTNTWTLVDLTGAPEGRKGATAVWTGDRMLAWGGAPPVFTNDPFDSGGSYDPVTDSWTEITTADAPEARSEHVAVWADGTMLIWGGRNVDDDALDTGGRYDPATGGKCKKVCPTLPEPARGRCRR